MSMTTGGGRIHYTLNICNIQPLKCIYTMHLWMLITTGEQMLPKNTFLSERLITHITAILTLPSMYTLMNIQVTFDTECFIT